MAVVEIHTIRRLIGTSGDEKPSPSPEGTEFHVIDTGELYIFHDGMWEPDRRLIYAIWQANL